MEIEQIYREFQALYTISEKIDYLEEMSRLNLPFDINWQGLIRAWSEAAAR